MSAHQVYSRSDAMIARIQRSGRKVRYWFSANGALVGIWQGRNGRTYAVGHDQQGRAIVYRAMAPHCGWNNLASM